MKAKLVWDAKVRNPAFNVAHAHTHAQTGIVFPNNSHLHSIPAPKGTIIVGPQAYRLVQLGMADPADDECRKRAGMTDEQIADAQKRHEPTYKRIHPDDRKLFDQGLIDGYKPGGGYKPGWAVGFSEERLEEALDDTDEDEDDG